MILRTPLSLNRSRHFANPDIFPNDQITPANTMPVENCAAEVYNADPTTFLFDERATQ
jgi:hypothetical protein